MFVARLRSKSDTPARTAPIRQNLDDCLRGALTQWVIFLKPAVMAGLKNDPNGIELWADSLVTRFRGASGKAVTMLENKVYGPQEVRNHEDLTTFVIDVIYTAAASGHRRKDWQQW